MPQPVGSRVGRKGDAVVPGEAALAAEPHMPVTIDQHPADAVVGQSVARGERCEGAAVVPAQAAAGRDPESPITVLGQSKYLDAGQSVEDAKRLPHTLALAGTRLHRAARTRLHHGTWTRYDGRARPRLHRPSGRRRSRHSRRGQDRHQRQREGMENRHRGLSIPSFLMRERSVPGFMSSRCAAPLSPSITQPASSRARWMWRFSFSTSVV